MFGPFQRMVGMDERPRQDTPTPPDPNTKHEPQQLEELACRFLCDEYISKGDPALCTLFADLHLLLAHARAGRATVITRCVQRVVCRVSVSFMGLTGR